MATPRCARQGGVTLFELLIVASITALLVGILFNRIAWYQRQAEMASAQQVVLALRAALQVQTTALLARDGGAEALVELSGQNPMDWLARAPVNYVGEYASPLINELQSGTWCYDKNNKMLIYLPINGKNVAQDSYKAMKYKVKLLKETSKSVKSKSADRIVLEQITG